MDAQASSEQTPSPSSKNYGRNWTKLILIYLITGAILYAGLYYFFFAKNKTNPYRTNQAIYTTPSVSSPSPQITQNVATASDQEAAKKQAEGFYAQWVDPKRLTSGYKETFEATIDTLVKEGYITQKAATQLKDRQVQYDIPTCSQNPLPFEQYKFSTPVVQGTTATMTVAGKYIGPPPVEKNVTLDLVKSGPTWSIDAFSCPPPPTIGR